MSVFFLICSLTVILGDAVHQTAYLKSLEATILWNRVKITFTIQSSDNGNILVERRPSIQPGPVRNTLSCRYGTLIELYGTMVKYAEAVEPCE